MVEPLVRMWVVMVPPEAAVSLSEMADLCSELCCVTPSKCWVLKVKVTLCTIVSGSLIISGHCTFSHCTFSVWCLLERSLMGQSPQRGVRLGQKNVISEVS